LCHDDRDEQSGDVITEKENMNAEHVSPTHMPICWCLAHEIRFPYAASHTSPAHADAE
jgi:hypothetical protein